MTIFLTLPAMAQDVSQEAQRYMIRGQVAMEDAKDLSGFQNAVSEFKKATELAPEWGDAWFNLGVAQEKAGDIPGAIRSYRKYLSLSPDATDYSDVETRIIRLEYRHEQAEQERIKRRQAEAEKARLDRLVQPFKGDWWRWACRDKKNYYRCNEKEVHGSNWDPSWYDVVAGIRGVTNFDFPGDGTVVISFGSRCGKIIGFPQGGDISDTKWFARLDIHSNGLTWTVREDGPWRQIWSDTRYGYIMVSCTRPVDESNYNPKTRFYYDLFKKP
ncbi:MAG: tetratricopeptide repeat protein [Proteobacteria bacterium]|nr:tetratricopeptide repeat protein [Pseudomonadota bacterium]